MKNILLVTLVFFLTACQQSPQKSFYLLTPLTPLAEKPAEQLTEQLSEQKETPINNLIGLGPIELPEYLNRPNMVRMSPDNKLNLATNDFWGEPLDKGIVRVLAINLVNHHPERMIQAFPWRSDRIPTHSFRVYIHELVLINGQVKINATWELVTTADKTLLERNHFIRITESENNGQAMAQSYSELLAELAEEMHKALLKVAQDPVR